MSMISGLSEGELLLLRNIIERKRPDLLVLIDSEAEVDLKEDEKRKAILDPVGSELARWGFDSKDNPTEYGLLLERLIDSLLKLGRITK